MKRLSRTIAYASAALMGLGAATNASALTLVLTNTGGVEEGTAAYHGFYAAKHYWESVLTDDVTVRINVGFTTQGFAPTTLGSASSSGSAKAKEVWRAAAIADATTTLDGIATQNLANFNNANVYLYTAAQKALGIYTGNPNSSDSTIRFNSAQNFDFDTRNGFEGPVPASDFVSVAVHEIGHALGFSSAVSQNSGPNSRPTNMDLFRYKNGQWDMSWGGDPYFSIDGGATNLFGNSFFSAGPDGRQTSHWRDAPRIHDGVNCTISEPQIGILDPTGGICQEGIVTANDLAALDAIGWNLNMDILANPGYQMRTRDILAAYLAVPEPATWAMMIAGSGMVGGAVRRSKREEKLALA